MIVIDLQPMKIMMKRVKKVSLKTMTLRKKMKKTRRACLFLKMRMFKFSWKKLESKEFLPGQEMTVVWGKMKRRMKKEV
jgi:hypothetical protein